MNNSLTFDWVVQTRPDIVYFDDVPDISTLPRDRLYGRLRASGMRFTKRWNLSSLYFSHAFINPVELACWGRILDWQKDCVIVDDQFNYIPWRWASAMNKPGREWAGYRNNEIPFAERQIGDNSSQFGNHTGYSMCKASFPGEGFFTRTMIENKIPFQPFAINMCLGKNVYHVRRKRGDCQFDFRTPEKMREWVKIPVCKPKGKASFEEWENDAKLCNKTDKKYTANAAC